MHRATDRAHRRGVALLEVLVAGVLLATGGVALLGLLGQTAQTLRNATATERSVDHASEELNRLLLFDRASLLARTGSTTVDGWRVAITPVSGALFDVAVAESDASPPLLQTTLYRPDSIDVPR